MKHNRIHVLCLAVQLVAVSQVSLADHHGHGHHHAGGMPWWWNAPGPYLYTPPAVEYFPSDFPYDYTNVLPYDYPAPALSPPPPPPAAVPPASTTPDGAQVWYYCTSAHGYYPYVAGCPDGWKVIPGTPPDLAK
jgi:hypothetical protein